MSQNVKKISKKSLSLLMVVMMLVGLIPFATAAPFEDVDQIKYAGGIQYWDADGKLVSNPNKLDTVDWAVSTSKTIAPTGTENVFEITLQVETIDTVTVEKKVVPDNAAVVLVIDISTSMQRQTGNEISCNTNPSGGVACSACSTTRCYNRISFEGTSSYANGRSRMAVAKVQARNFLINYLGDQGNPESHRLSFARHQEH